jgi:hypothetical protein
MLERQQYKDWDIYDTMPDGWRIDRAGSPLHGHVFITNGKSPLNGQKRALLKVVRPTTKKKEHVQLLLNVNPPAQAAPKMLEPLGEAERQEYAKALQELARKKFQEQLMRDLVIDFSVCRIEGWDFKEYVNELKAMIEDLLVKLLNTNTCNQEGRTTNHGR